MNFHVVTIFPPAFDSYLKESIIGRAIKNKKINIKFYNPRDFVKTGDWYKQVDDRPYGGGPGMVMQAEPILKAVEKIKKNKLARRGGKTKIIIFSPSGKKFTNEYAKNLAKKYTDVVMISGRYEGIDARVKKILKADLSTKALASVEDVSIGDYVLTGGELPAMVLIDSTARQISGVLHKSESLEESRISSSEVYTRPEKLVYKGKSYKVPKVLTSGNHADIEAWKQGKKGI